MQSAARGGRPPFPPPLAGLFQKSYQRIFDEIFWRGVVYSLEEVNRLDNFTKFKAFEALDVSEKNCLLPRKFCTVIVKTVQTPKHKL